MDARVVETHRTHTHTHAWSLQNHTPSLPGCPPGSVHFVSGVPHRDHIRRGTWPRAFLSLYSTHPSHIYTRTSPPHTPHIHTHTHHTYTPTHTHTHHTPHPHTHHTYTHTYTHKPTHTPIHITPLTPPHTTRTHTHTPHISHTYHIHIHTTYR